MNVVHPIRQGIETTVPCVDQATDLQRFLEPQSAAALWTRSLPKGPMGWLAALDPAHLPSGRVILRRDDVAPVVGELCDMVAMPQGPERDWLEADIAALATIFADLVKARYLRLRLDVVTTNACRKFHVDAITARLVCTYLARARNTGWRCGVKILNAYSPCLPGCRSCCGAACGHLNRRRGCCIARRRSRGQAKRGLCWCLIR